MVGVALPLPVGLSPAHWFQYWAMYEPEDGKSRALEKFLEFVDDHADHPGERKGTRGDDQMALAV